MKKLILITALSMMSLNVLAASNHQNGSIENLTVSTSGIMIKLSSGLPDNCEGTPYGWLLVKQEHSALTSVVLAAWATGNSSATVYTAGRENGSGFCLVTQFDPAG